MTGTAAARLLTAGLSAAAGFGLCAAWSARRLAALRKALGEARRRALELEQVSSERRREVQTLHAVADTVAGPQPRTQPTLAAIVSIVARYLEADVVGFLLLDEETGELAAQPGGYGLEGPDRLYRISLDEERSSSVRAFKTGRPFWTGDAQSDAGSLPGYARLWGIHSLMVVPIRVGGRSIGVMRAGSFKKDFFNEEQLELLTVIAEEAAVIVETALLNRRLSDATEQMRAANRMKDEFVSTVSHEFKTPLTTILGFVSVLLSGDAGSLSPQQAHFLDVIRGAAKRLGVMVSELLDLARLEGGAVLEMKAVPLGELIAAAVEHLQPRAQDGGLRLVSEVPAGLPPVRGDSRWLVLVVENLLSNAVKFSPRGGEIRVAASVKGDCLVVCVEDEGVGFGAEESERIFEKFYRAPNAAAISAPGTGLGLSISRDVVERHGGRIWCESEPGKGSRFFFALPTAAREEVLELS